MIPVLSRTEMREFDRRATALYSVPSLVLMENAARGATDVIVREYCAGSAAQKRFVVACGPGNNPESRFFTRGVEIFDFDLNDL